MKNLSNNLIFFQKLRLTSQSGDCGLAERSGENLQKPVQACVARFRIRARLEAIPKKKTTLLLKTVDENLDLVLVVLALLEALLPMSAPSSQSRSSLLSEAERQARRLRKRLRQIAHLRTLHRELNGEEQSKVDKEAEDRERLEGILADMKRRSEEAGVEGEAVKRRRESSSSSLAQSADHLGQEQQLEVSRRSGDTSQERKGTDRDRTPLQVRKKALKYPAKALIPLIIFCREGL